jgi:hypothetical protein
MSKEESVTQEAPSVTDKTKEETEPQTETTGTEHKINGVETPVPPVPNAEHSASVPAPVPSPRITPEQVKNYIVDRLIQGASYKQVSDETHIPKTNIFRLFPKEYIAMLREERSEEDQGEDEAMEPEPTRISRTPTAHYLVPDTWIDDLMSNQPLPQQRLVRAWKSNVIKYNELLQREQQQNRPSNDGGQGGEALPAFVRSAEDFEHWKFGLLAVAKAQQLKYKSLFGEESNPGGFQDILNAIKVGVDLVPKAGGSNQLSDYRLGRTDEASVQAKLASASSGKETNSSDIQLEALRQSHDTDMKRIDFEVKKYFLSLENDKDKWQHIEDTFKPFFEMAGPEIKGAIKGIGESVGRSFQNNPGRNPSMGNPEFLELTCPKCGVTVGVPKHLLPTDQDKVKTKCPSCGEVFGLEATEEAEKEEPPAEIRPKVDRSRLHAAYT